MLYLFILLINVILTTSLLVFLSIRPRVAPLVFRLVVRIALRRSRSRNVVSLIEWRAASVTKFGVHTILHSAVCAVTNIVVALCRCCLWISFGLVHFLPPGFFKPVDLFITSRSPSSGVTTTSSCPSSVRSSSVSCCVLSQSHFLEGDS